MNKWRGFTLIELLVSMSILAVLSTILLGAWLGGLRNFGLLTSSAQSNTAYIEAYTRLDNWVRQAIEFPTSYTNPSTNVSYYAGPTTLIMRLYSIDANSATCNYSDYVIYTLTGRDLREIVVTDPHSARQNHDQIVANNVSIVVFEQLKGSATDHRVIRASITLNQKVSGRPVLETHTQYMVARND